MMQAVLQQHLGPGFQVESAGALKVAAGLSANPRSIACMEARGVDLSGHERRWIGDLDLAAYSWIVCVGQDEADKVRAALGGRAAKVIVANAQAGGISDPYELGLAGYRDCLALLDEVMPPVAKQIADR